MNDFELARPASGAEAVAALTAAPGGVILAGGQDVLALMKDYVETPPRLVSLSAVPLRKIELGGNGGLTVGAMVTLAELAESSVVRTRWPLLAQAAGSAASPQIRNLGTVGGNLCQRPRCWYYRAENLVCLRKGGDKCLALEGDHRYHAIFGDGPCHNPNMASLAVPLLAYGARVEILGPKGPRTVPLESIYDPYGGNIRSDTNLAPDDVLQHVLLDAADGVHAAHEEVRPRHCQDWPLATASVVLRLNGPNVAAARVVLGAVATSPLLCAPAAAALMGRPPSAASAAAAAEAAVRDAKPLAQNAHKVTITRHLVRRVILAAAGLAQV